MTLNAHTDACTAMAERAAQQFHIMAAGTCSAAEGWKPLELSVAEPGVHVGFLPQGPSQ